MENIRDLTWTKIERIKEETGSVGTVIGWQNVENIRELTWTKIERIKE